MNNSRLKDAIFGLIPESTSDDVLTDLADDTTWINIQFDMAFDKEIDAFARQFYLEQIGEVVRLSTTSTFSDHVADRLTALFAQSDAGRQAQILDAIINYYPFSFRRRPDILALAQRTFKAHPTEGLAGKAGQLVALTDWKTTQPTLQTDLLVVLKDWAFPPIARQWAIAALGQVKDRAEVRDALLYTLHNDPSSVVRQDARAYVGTRITEVVQRFAESVLRLSRIVFPVNQTAAPAVKSAMPETIVGDSEQDGVAYRWSLFYRDQQRFFELNTLDLTLSGQVILACLKDDGSQQFCGFILLHQVKGFAALAGFLPVSRDVREPVRLVIAPPEDISPEDVPLLWTSFQANVRGHWSVEPAWAAWLEALPEETLAAWNAFCDSER